MSGILSKDQTVCKGYVQTKSGHWQVQRQHRHMIMTFFMCKYELDQIHSGKLPF